MYIDSVCERERSFFSMVLRVVEITLESCAQLIQGKVRLNVERGLE